MAADLEDQVLQELYAWVDKIPLSKPKKNMARDFADGVLMAEVVKYFFPKLVELHNFPMSHGSVGKKKNWQLLNWKVFKRLNFELSNDVIDSLVACKPGTIERVLLLLRAKIDKESLQNSSPTAGGMAGISKRSEGVAGGVSQPAMDGEATGRSMASGNAMNGVEFVPRIAYEEKVQESLGKDEMIKILGAKVTKLDHLLRLKDLRIDELQRKLGDSLHTHAGGDSPRSRQYYAQAQFSPPTQAHYSNLPAPYYYATQQAERR